MPFFWNSHLLCSLLFFFCVGDRLVDWVFAGHDLWYHDKYTFSGESDIIVELLQIHTCGWCVSPFCPGCESGYLCLIACDFFFSASESFFSLRIFIPSDDELYHEKCEEKYHADEDVVFIHRVFTRVILVETRPSCVLEIVRPLLHWRARLHAYFSHGEQN